MRAIKFRAWDGERMWFSGDELWWLGTWFDAHCNVLKKSGVEFMQFIGLHDKNGKEIYEGDFVRAWSQGSCGTFQIYWRQEGSPSWILFPAWQERQFWHLHATEHKPEKQFLSVAGEITITEKEGFFDDGVEVIGNIYENPELLGEI